ncbi:hypothetical protein [Nocardioides marmoraquaticus]
MSESTPGADDGLAGRVDDAEEEQAASSSTDGPAAEGEYDAAQGSPDGGAHPVAEEFPQEDPRHDA